MWLLLAGFILFSIGYYVYRTYTVSDGTRTGILFKVSKRGIIFKTFEGQLQLGGSTMMNQMSVWEFSAQNAQVYAQLQQLEGKSVRCYYRQLVDPFPWQGDTEYIVYKVEAGQ